MTENIRQLLEQIERQTAGKCLFRCRRNGIIEEVSSECFFEQIRVRSRIFLRMGLGGKKIGIMGRNSCEWMISFCAVFWSGSVAVLLDRELREEELSGLVKRVELDGIVYDRSAAGVVCESSPGKELQRIPMSVFEDEASEEFGESENWKAEQQRIRNRKPEELACIFFTSGTTGISKAVMMSEHGMIAGITSGINERNYEAFLAVLPFHHMAGFIMILNTMYLGTIICIADDLKYFFQCLEQMKPDYVAVVPSMLPMLARKVKRGGPNGRNLGWNLHSIHCGGAAFQSETLQVFLDQNITVLQGYGASEAGGIGFLWEMTPDRPDTIGKPPKGMEVRITDGELYLRSESVMMGYYGDEEGTQEVLKDGWYATGDLCRQDEEGYLYLIGRKKNLIILSNGENVSPEEIERWFASCREIKEIKVGTEQNRIAAWICPQYPENASESEKAAVLDMIRDTVERCNQRVPLYKQIQKVIISERALEKTASGKLIRRDKGEGGICDEGNDRTGSQE
ncbi:MAG: AMP-binding protein [Fusicatenibacter sp.]|nr:AMP-binding protein [Lachnospiraceae bacterium]MDY2936696.1 AMP-binding protein [Fusicatenibacter sp.]